MHRRQLYNNTSITFITSLGFAPPIYDVQRPTARLPCMQRPPRQMIRMERTCRHDWTHITNKGIKQAAKYSLVVKL
jgi:hypothetical protein